MNWAVYTEEIAPGVWSARAEIDDEHVYTCVGALSKEAAVDSAEGFVRQRLAARQRTAERPQSERITEKEIPVVAGEFEGKS